MKIVKNIVIINIIITIIGIIIGISRITIVLKALGVDIDSDDGASSEVGDSVRYQIDDANIQKLLAMSDAEVWELLTGTRYEQKPKLSEVNKQNIESRITTITVPIRTKNGSDNMEIKVNKELEGLFKAFFQDLYQNATSFIIEKENCIGYIWKHTTGSSSDTLSAHAIGAAVDINWADNKQGTKPPKKFDDIKGSRKKYVIYEKSDMVKIAKSYTLCWGGFFKTSLPDGMHFSFIGDWSRSKTRSEYN